MTDLNAGIERMRNRLKKVESIAMAALCNQPDGTLACWQHLSKAQGEIYDLLAVGWKKLVEGAEYRTPKAALDSVAGDRPLDRMLKESITDEVVVSKNATTTYGNTAAIREAVEAVVRAISEPNEVLSALLLMQAEAKCKAALAEPPRNCDLFGGDYKMLHTAWFDWTGSPSGQNPDGTAKMGFGEWLLALAGKRGAV